MTKLGVKNWGTSRLSPSCRQNQSGRVAHLSPGTNQLRVPHPLLLAKGGRHDIRRETPPQRGSRRSVFRVIIESQFCWPNLFRSELSEGSSTIQAATTRHPRITFRNQLFSSFRTTYSGFSFLRFSGPCVGHCYTTTAASHPC